MKKVLAILFSFCLTFTLFGCRQQPSIISSPTTEPSADADVTVETTQTSVRPADRSPMVSVSVPIVTETATASNGTEIFRYLYQNMTLAVPEQEVADQIIIDFLNRVDKSVVPADTVRQQAIAGYQDTGSWIPYLYSLIYNPTRIDQSVLSLYGTNVSYSGYSHPTYDCISANYNMITGHVLTLGSILTHADRLTDLENLLLSALDAIAEEKYLRGDYETTVNQRFSGNESYDEAWFFTPSGLNFYFSPYEIAPYSSGIITVEIPYEKLTGIIDDAFFPAERDTTSGSVTLQPMADADLTSFSQISELILDKGGKQLLLHTEGTVRNLRIIMEHPLTADVYTLFATSHLSLADAVMLEVSQDNIEHLSIVYEQNGSTVTLPLPAN